MNSTFNNAVLRQQQNDEGFLWLICMHFKSAGCFASLVNILLLKTFNAKRCGGGGGQKRKERKKKTKTNERISIIVTDTNATVLGTSCFMCFNAVCLFLLHSVMTSLWQLSIALNDYLTRHNMYDYVHVIICTVVSARWTTVDWSWHKEWN